MTVRATSRHSPKPATPAARVSPEQATDPPAQPDTDDAAYEVWTLIVKVQNGDAESFGLIYDRYLDTVFRYVYFRVGHRQTAEDITSETFTRAYKRINHFSWQGRDFGAWLVTIARNQIADYFKSARYRLENVTGELVGADSADHSPEGDPEAAVIDKLTNATLRQAVGKLTAEQQECIELRFLAGMTVSETAHKMGRNEGAVKALTYRAVRTLFRLLQDGFMTQT